MHRVIVVAIVAIAVAAMGPSVVDASSEFELSGTWSSAQPNAGTTLVLTQSGDTIRWTGGPQDQAWVQTFQGTINGGIFHGEFKQDEPGHQPPRYHGSIEAQVINDCEFKTLHVLQEGQADAGGVVFTKAGCTAPVISGTWQVRAKQKLGSTLVAMVGGGAFSGDASGQLTSTHSASGSLIVSLLDETRIHRHSDVWHMKITGPGSYRSAATSDGSGAIKLVAEIVSTANHSQAHFCKADPFGTLTLRPDGPTGPTAGLSICGRNLATRATLARAIKHA